jgi:uncharacterized protein (DUF2252 family)
MSTIEAPTARGRRPATLPTVAERAAGGRTARQISPRSAHGTWVAPPDRRSALDILEDEAADRLADLVPIRYGRMAASPFSYYRGAAAVMAADLAPAPRTGLRVQLCGDAHLSNFGGFAAPDRRLVFSINDFDETLPGPFEWDLKRLVASFAVAGRAREFSDLKRSDVITTVVQAYRSAMREFSTMSSLAVWYTRLDMDQIVARFAADAGPKELRSFQRAVTKAESKDGLKAMTKLTEVVDGKARFLSDPPIVERLEDLLGVDAAASFKSQAAKLMRSYTSTLNEDRRVLVSRYRFADIARKVVGVGSVGTRAWVVLMLGRDESDPLLLQFKEAQASVLEPHLGASVFSHHGRRVVEGQRLMQAASDILLGWQRMAGIDGRTRDFFVRQLWDKKGAAVIEEMTPRGMRLYARFCGWTLARAHARSGDPIAIASYLGTSDTFDRTMVDFAESYADQNALDHGELVAAIGVGRIKAISGI